MSAECDAGKAEDARASRSGGDQEPQMTGENNNRLKDRGGEFEALLDRYAGTVYWLALYVTGDSKDAEEVLQKTFLAAQSGFPDRKQNESSVMRLARTAMSESFAKLRIRDATKLLRLSSEGEAGVTLVPQEVVDWVDNVEKRYTREELRKILREAMIRLTPFSRVVFLLHDVANLRDQEIADLLHRPVASIKSHLLHGRLQLREHLNECFKPSVQVANRIG